MIQNAEFQNLHTHTYRCKHAVGDAPNFAKIVAQSGGNILGMADHNPFEDGRWDGERMGWGELDAYQEAIAQAQACHPKLQILTGLECEYAPDSYTIYKEEFLGRRQMDYLIGAAHYFKMGKSWHSSFHDLNRPRALAAYVEGLASLMESGLFLFIAHPDLFGCGYPSWNADLQKASEEICQIALKTKTPLELNCSGFRKHWRGHGKARPFPYPWKNFWEVVASYGTAVVLSSDAHHPHEYYKNLDQGWRLSQRLGLCLVNPISLLNKTNEK